MIADLNLFDIEAEPWSQQLAIDLLQQTLNALIKTYNDKQSVASTTRDYLNLQQILLALNDHYVQLLREIHKIYYGFFSHFIAIDRLLRHYASLANFDLCLKKEAIWLAHRLALLLDSKSYLGRDNVALPALVDLNRLSLQETVALRQAYDALLKHFALKLHFLR